MVWPEDVVEADLDEYNMREVTVNRLRHGQGMYRFDDERGMYSGSWQRNLRHGTGEAVGISGRFQGSFVKDWRRGEGVHYFANGDVYRGTFAARGHHPRASLIYGDEYMDGLPHGEGKLTFVDGSEFVGSFDTGAAHGYGSYTTPEGEIQRGVFHQLGMLHGPGMEVLSKDHVCSGEFVHGALHGKGMEHDARGAYKGTFKHGDRDGHGVQTLPHLRGEYVGGFMKGLRHGRGVLTYGRGVPHAMTAGGLVLDEGFLAAEHGSGDSETAVDGGAGESKSTGPGLVAHVATASGGSFGQPQATKPPASKRGTSTAKFLRSMLGGFSHDVCCEGSWAGGSLSSGGLVRRRHHATEPRKEHMYSTVFADSRFLDLKRLSGDEFQSNIARQTEYVERSTALLDKRLQLESEYMQRYRRWGRHASKSLRRAQRLVGGCGRRCTRAAGFG